MKGKVILRLLLVLLVLSSCKKDEDVDPVEQYLGIFQLEDNCSAEGYDYSVYVTRSSENSSTILISNLADFGMGLTIPAFVTGNSFDIPQDIINGFDISGSGQINGNTIIINYTIKFSDKDLDCTASGVKL